MKANKEDMVWNMVVKITDAMKIVNELDSDTDKGHTIMGACINAYMMYLKGTDAANPKYLYEFREKMTKLVDAIIEKSYETQEDA